MIRFITQLFTKYNHNPWIKSILSIIIVASVLCIFSSIVAFLIWLSTVSFWLAVIFTVVFSIIFMRFIIFGEDG